jgi:hypothetical protein
MEDQPRYYGFFILQLGENVIKNVADVYYMFDELEAVGEENPGLLPVFKLPGVEDGA